MSQLLLFNTFFGPKLLNWPMTITNSSHASPPGLDVFSPTSRGDRSQLCTMREGIMVVSPR